ncbi:MAG: sigma factor-like helix-turn-helix DNA-binding protein [Planctomycetota bacterium]
MNEAVTSAETRPTPRVTAGPLVEAARRHTTDTARPIDREHLKVLFRENLASRERLILLLQHHEKMTPAEIGHVLDLSEPEVRRRQRALRQRLDALLRRGRSD